MKKEEIAEICKNWDDQNPDAPSSHPFFQAGLRLGIYLDGDPRWAPEMAFSVWIHENPDAPWGEHSFMTGGSSIDDPPPAPDWDAFFYGFTAPGP